MSHTLRQSFFMCALMCGAAIVGVAAGSQSPAGAAAQADASASSFTAEDEAARAVFERACSSCHDSAIATTAMRTPQDWDEILELMAAMGADASAAESVQIRRHLNRRYGRVNVNRATAEDLELVLGVTAEVAKALVEYRATARFTAVEDLAKVPGFPAARVTGLKPHVQF